MVIKIVAKIKKVLLDFTFINIIDDYQKFSPKKDILKFYKSLTHLLEFFSCF